MLRDPDKRQRYDRYGHAGLERRRDCRTSTTPSRSSDLFGDIFGDLFGGGRRGGPQPGRDLQVDVEIDLVEAARGVTKTITIPREENCAPTAPAPAPKRGTRPADVPALRRPGRRPHAARASSASSRPAPAAAAAARSSPTRAPTVTGRGRVSVRRTLEVNIPPGVDTGDRIRVSGEGEAGDPGRRAATCTASSASANTAVPPRRRPPDLPGADHVQPGRPRRPRSRCRRSTGRSSTRSSAACRAARWSGSPAKACPTSARRPGGDLLVQVIVETPRHLTKRQEELFRELAEIDQKHVSPRAQELSGEDEASFSRRARSRSSRSTASHVAACDELPSREAMTTTEETRQ